MGKVQPIRQFITEGERMTALEAFAWVLSRYIGQPLKAFVWRARITPALRERCVDFVVRSGCSGAWNIKREAAELAEYIARGDA